MDYAILVALPQELDNMDNIFYTGVGKVNATRVATEVICKHQPKMIINYGTAGSFKKELSGLVQCTSFVQHDMNATAQGFKFGETPFESNSEVIVSENDNGYRCGSGDYFVTSPVSVKCDVVEMEAYGIAKVTRHYKTPFLCYKFISDNADEHAASDWIEMCGQGSKLFKNKFKEIVNAVE